MNIIRTFTIAGVLLLPVAAWADSYSVYPTTPYGTHGNPNYNTKRLSPNFVSPGQIIQPSGPLAPTFVQPAPNYYNNPQNTFSSPGGTPNYYYNNPQDTFGSGW